MNSTNDEFEQEDWIEGLNALQDTSQLLERIMHFQDWGFKQSFIQVYSYYPPIVIYESEFCRVQFWLVVAEDEDRGHSMEIYYGRLHAPNNEETIIWNGEKCWCWYCLDFDPGPLYFLDRLSPQEAATKYQARAKQKKWLAEPVQFLQPEVADQISPGRYPNPELVARTHAAIWEHYGLRFFKLFDLRHPDLWNAYSAFNSEYQKIKGSKYELDYRIA